MSVVSIVIILRLAAYPPPLGFFLRRGCLRVFVDGFLWGLRRKMFEIYVGLFLCLRVGNGSGVGYDSCVGFCAFWVSALRSD